MYNELYLKEIKECSKKLDLEFLQNKTLFLSGATGLIISFLIDCVLINKNINVKLVALVRNTNKAKERFKYFVDDSRLEFVSSSILEKIDYKNKLDYVIHAASLTDPLNYSLHPIEVMNTNYIGCNNLLELASKNNAKFLLLSSCEVYGKNDNLNIKENDYGYIDILDTRSCYNESKKASETLCACYHKEKNVDVVIARLSRIYGPSMKLEDTKALSQFINKNLNNEDIVLKSTGEQLFNYTYVFDTVKALLVLLKEKNKHLSYNVNSDELIKLRDIANYIASLNNKKVIFDLPNEIEKAGFSKCTNSALDATLFTNEFNFQFETKLFDGLKKTIAILKNK